VDLGASYFTLVKVRLIPFATKYTGSPKNLVFDNACFLVILSDITEKECIKGR